MSASILQKNWLIARYLEAEIRHAAGHAKGLLLDAGCGNKPYAWLFADKVKKHIGLDMGSSLTNDSLDVYGQILALPFKDEVFSTILCTEALQCVQVPQDAMAEFFRVLKKSGILILTTTQMWHITNAPYDCYRFTEFGLKHLAEQAGFKVQYHKALGSFWLRMGLKFCYFVHRFNKAKFLDLPIRLFLIVPQLFFLAMDNLFFDRKDVINHMMILTKA